MAKTDGVARIIALAALGKNGGGTTDYLELANKPKINNVELTGNKTLEDLGINIPELPMASADTLGGIKIGENLTIDENGVVNASGIKGLYTIGILNLGGGSPFNLTDEEKIQFNNIITDASSKNHSSVGIFAYADSGDMQPSTIGPYMHCCLLYTVSSIKNTSTSFKFAGCYPLLGSIAQVKMLNITISGSWSNGVFTGTSYICEWSDANLATKTDVLVKTNTTPYTPTSDYNPATKKYVDDAIQSAITNTLEGSY